MTDKPGAQDAPQISDGTPQVAEPVAPEEPRSDHVVISLADLEALISKRVDEALSTLPQAQQMDPQKPMEHRLVVLRDHGRGGTDNEVMKEATFDQAAERIRELFDDPADTVTHIEHIPEVGTQVMYIHPDLLPAR